MEELLCNRLRSRHQRLVDLTISAKEMIDKCSQGGVVADQFTLCHLKLKQCLDAFERELFNSIGKIQDVSLINSMTDSQLTAEETVVIMEATLQADKTMETSTSTTTKLPKLELPKFNGDKLKCNEFWDRFEANVHNQTIADADKLSYLFSSLEDIALKAIAGIPTTNVNYKIAVETLKNRFGDKHGLIDAHYSALSDIPRAEDSAISCRNTLDLIERHLRVLEELGEPVNGNNLRATVLKKFPDRVIREHHLIHGDDNSMTLIRKNLSRVITSMEKPSELMGQGNIQPLVTAGTSTGTTTEALQIRSEVRAIKFKPNRKRKLNSSTETLPPKRPRRRCLFCNLDNHASVDCKKIRTIEARKEKLKDRCLQCLRRNHTTQNCKRKISCYRCKGDHLLIFCPKAKSGKDNKPDSSISTILCNMTYGYTFLQTAVAEIQNPTTNKFKRPSRLLLDSGSQHSYITERAAKVLKLPVVKEDLLTIYTFGASSPKETVSPCSEIVIKTKRGVKHKIHVNIVPHITDRVPVSKYHHEDIDIFADDDTTGEAIDLLVGNDFLCSFMRDDKVKISNNLFLIDTDFGWVLSGKVTSENESDALSVSTYCQCHTPNCPYFTEPDLPLRNIDIKFLWSLECIGITDSPKATRQEEAVRFFNETVKYKNGRYEVKWPWIQYPPDLPSNFGLAYGRMKSVLKRMDKDTLEEYDAILKEQLELGIVEVIDPHSEIQDDRPIHYISHHMVKQKGKRGRIVYDASAKAKGHKSLNECLYSGPSMLEDLTALLLKFRTKIVGIVADVEKAFLQVGLQEEDRDVTRFLWVKDIKKDLSEENLLYLRFCRVPFGIISSPFLLTATIRFHLSQSNESLLKTVAERCYVDNLVTAAASTQEARQIYEQTRSTFEHIGMNIRDWVSNDINFMNMIPKQHLSPRADKIKVLGLMWDVQKDTLMLKDTEEHFNTQMKTKREVLRSLARIYDPCGFVCPLVLPIKLLFQDICKKKIKWDEELPQDLVETAQNILESLRAVTKIQLSRFIGTESSDNDVTYELHCFTDASKKAYAAVVYLRVESPHQTSIAFVMAKSRVSQVEDQDDLKIPKLELLGFLIGSRLLKYVKNSLELNVSKEYLWTDSLVVLAWMKSHKLLPPFVANRVNEIKRNQPPTEMCYISTKLNPADIATRPELWEQKSNFWYHGPEFLKDIQEKWPKNHDYETQQTFLSVGEALDGYPGELEREQETDHDVTMDMHTSELRVQSKEACDHTGSNSLDETILEIKKLQQIHFPEELTGKKTHLMRNLDLFLDIDGVLRCCGRMTNTTWSYDKKYPILLPKNSEFTNKVIKEVHESNYHVGASHTLSTIRERYWIPQGKAQVQKVIRKCTQCIKHGGGPYKLPTAPALPPERVNYSEPFTFTGIDYLGPLYVSTTTGKEKRWVVLLTCLAVRAVHLDIVKDLTAEECLLALRRFMAARGIPKKLYSDNAIYFKLTSEIMEQPLCIQNKIQWKFIPQLAPWQGGFYERLVALVKHCLKRTLEKHLLNDSKLLTVMKEVEAVINSRPLTSVGPELEHILRPKDFLSLGKCLTVEPSSAEVPNVGTTTKVELIKSWKRGLVVLEEFKKMFIGQYLTSLRERSRHEPKQPRIKSHRAPQIDDFVQIKSEDKNRINWKNGKIVALVEGVDGECRVAKVQVGDSIFTRSIGHLYPLEIEGDGSGDSQIKEVTEEVSIPDIPILNSDSDMSGHMDREIQNESQTQPPIIPSPEVTPTTEIGIEPAHDEAIAAPIEDGYQMTVPSIQADTDMETESTPPDEHQEREVEQGSKRSAAIRAREKIRELTRFLLTVLQ